MRTPRKHMSPIVPTCNACKHRSIFKNAGAVRMISWQRRIILLFTALLLLAGCSGEKAILPDMPKDGKGVVKVMYFHEQSFYRKYGDLFAIKYPNIGLKSSVLIC